MFVQLKRDGCFLWIEVTGIQGEVCHCMPHTACPDRDNLYPVGIAVDVNAPEIIDLKI